MALILGELQTNALKHGALRSDHGRIRISGSRHGNALSLRWAEDCGFEVTPPSETGGGVQLINRLGGAGGTPPTINWSKRGVVIEFDLRCAD